MTLSRQSDWGYGVPSEDSMGMQLDRNIGVFFSCRASHGK
jgi:hypothetical protein